MPMSETGDQPSSETDVAAEKLREAEQKIANLERALTTNRVIGMAIGILVEWQQINTDDAFKLMARASQESNLRVSQIAEHVVQSRGGDASGDVDSATSALQELLGHKLTDRVN